MPGPSSDPPRAGTTHPGHETRTGAAEPPRGRGRRGGEDEGVAWCGTPRAGGDEVICLETGIRASGTPPRGRGRRGPRIRVHPVGRNTPARAGTTSTIPPAADHPGEHPRAGGDDRAWDCTSAAVRGTPPRGRGRRYRGGGHHPGTGNTPARAGTTESCWAASCSLPEHPRAGGDDTSRAVGTGSSVGTPPRGRGRRSYGAPPWRVRRNTPARAGTTRGHRWTRSHSREHPRAGGDDATAGGAPVTGTGTPPRGRGRHRTGPSRGAR